MAATISTHVLDTARGVPAAGISVGLFALEGSARRLLGVRVTNVDGRTDASWDGVEPGTYELVFAVTDYFARDGIATFFDEIPLRFIVGATEDRYHIPLLLGPWAYSTYRGS